MDFEVTEFQRELCEGVRRLLDGVYPLDRVRAPEGSPRVVDREGWAQLGAAGIFDLRLPEAAGGTGLGTAEAALVFEELGRALVPGPLVATHLAAGTVDGAADGSAVVGLVWRADGAVPAVPLVLEHLADLDALLVADVDGVTAVDPGTLDASPLDRPMDPLTPLWVVDAIPAGERVAGPDVVVAWRRDLAVLTGAFQVGLAAWATDLAVAYAKGRSQFGRPIGSFQAVKHLCADMAVRTELARCAVQAAAVTVDQPDVGDPGLAAAGARLLADEAAVTNGRSCIQVHGGMGFTWEVPAHLAYKRARVLATHPGGGAPARELLAGSLG